MGFNVTVKKMPNNSQQDGWGAGGGFNWRLQSMQKGESIPLHKRNGDRVPLCDAALEMVRNRRGWAYMGCASLSG